MRIHTTSQGENITDIANLYGVSEENIRNVNNLFGTEPAVGEELLIQVPTRSYTTVYGDTPERIALRFGIRKNDIYLLNPWIVGKPLDVGQKLTLKTGQRKYGMAVANGYFYNGCDLEKLVRALPFLTYVTFASARATRHGINKTFDDKKDVMIVSENQKIPLVRVFDEYHDRYKHKENLQEFADQLIDLALKGKYKGIVLDSCMLKDSAEEFSSFLVILRKLMIGCDLILITEINESSPPEFSEFADGSVLYYPKFAMANPPSFENGERKIMGDFAYLCESAKTFIDLPSMASAGGEFMSHNDAINLARRRGYEIKENENTLLSHFCDRKQGEYKFTSMNGTRAILELINEFDYMGVCFDIMRTPLWQLMMYNSMFKTSYYTNVRSREGCSRGGED